MPSQSGLNNNSIIYRLFRKNRLTAIFSCIYAKKAVPLCCKKTCTMQPKSKQKLKLGITIAVGILYLIVPTDLLPDTMPLVGWIDDIIAILLVIANAVRVINKLKNKN